MNNLLKADFRRVMKDKLLLVMGILAVAFAVVTPLLYTVILAGLDIDGNDMEIGMLFQFNAKSQFFAAFSLGNNLGLIVPVLIAIVLCKDFSFGTVRNKIIAGNCRRNIFLSLFISCAVVLTAVMLLHAFITLAVSRCFFDYQQTPFTFADFWYFLESLCLEILVLLFVASMLSWLCASMKNVGLVIVLYIAIAFVCILIGTILQTVITVMEFVESDESVLSVLRFVSRINMFNVSSQIGTGTHYALKDILYIVVPSTVGIVGFLGLGFLKFRKKDLK